jgi:nicotinamidase-related amidase
LTVFNISRKHRLPRAPVLALLQDAMPRPGLPLVHFNDTRCASVAELRSIIRKARRLADDHAEQERASAAVKAWLLAQIEKKRARPDADIAKPAPDQPFAPERLAA